MTSATDQPDTPVSPGRRLALPVVFSIVVFVIVGFLSANFRYAETLPYAFGGDYLQEYVGGWIVLQGDHARFYDADHAYAKELEHDPNVVGFRWKSGQWFPMIYPPFYYLLVAPLSLLPIRVAALIWVALMVAAFTGAVVLLARHFPQRTILPWALPAGLFFAPALESLSSGQKATLILLILTATYVLLDRCRPFWAGVVFGLIAFKPQLALVIGLALLCKRQWHFVAGAVVTTNVLVGLCFVVGFDVSRQYFEISQRMGTYIETGGYPIAKLHCWYGFARLLLHGAPLNQVQFVTAILDLITIGVLVRLLWGPLAFGTPAFALQFSGLVLATLLLSPHLLTYDLTPLLLPMILLIVLVTEVDSALTRYRRPVAWLVALLYVLGIVSARLAPLLHVQLSVLAIFALLLWLAWVVTPAAALGYNGVPKGGNPT